MNRRRLLLGAGGVAALVAVLLADADLRSALPVEAAVSLLGNDYLFAAALGVLALVLAVAVAQHGRTFRQTRMPEPERPATVPPAGEAFDRAVERKAYALPFVGRSDREAVRERLRAAAAGALVRSDGVRSEEAERRVRTGEWPDDDLAAAFLAEEQRPTPSIGGWARALGDGRSWFGHCASRTAAVVVESDADARRGESR